MRYPDKDYGGMTLRHFHRQVSENRGGLVTLELHKERGGYRGFRSSHDLSGLQGLRTT